ncbi:hypothetical protein LTR53_002862 [Teratosphaeriaceae sp. CCFEE 6253]|nr:hypothetical protein LTR53_002862 [Teratosphaeriaceae sp. CCFEE 6253]
MPPSAIQHRRTHNILLINKLLGQRNTSSPFTLVLDSLEQSGKPLVTEYAANVHVVFVSLETLRTPRDADTFIAAWKLSLQTWQREVTAVLRERQGSLVVFDSLNALAATEPTNLASLLLAFISPTTSLVAVYHQDVPLPVSQSGHNAYSPTPLTLLKYLATTIFTVHSLNHVLACKAARERSHVEPSFGLTEGKEGVMQGLGSNGQTGVVLEMEYRRKSGRGLRESYFLARPQQDSTTTMARCSKGDVTLLEDHPLYRSPGQDAAASGSGDAEGTFELGLTDKQKRDREGVVLPYFDAQKGDGDGGRILYDMGSEDDFDEEEDEI